MSVEEHRSHDGFFLLVSRFIAGSRRAVVGIVAGLTSVSGFSACVVTISVTLVYDRDQAKCSGVRRCDVVAGLCARVALGRSQGCLAEREIGGERWKTMPGSLII